MSKVWCVGQSSARAMREECQTPQAKCALHRNAADQSGESASVKLSVANSESCWFSQWSLQTTPLQATGRFCISSETISHNLSIPKRTFISRRSVLQPCPVSLPGFLLNNKTTQYKYLVPGIYFCISCWELEDALARSLFLIKISSRHLEPAISRLITYHTSPHVHCSHTDVFAIPHTCLACSGSENLF